MARKKKSKVKSCFVGLFLLIIVGILVGAGVIYYLNSGNDTADVVFANGSVVIKSKGNIGGAGGEAWGPLKEGIVIKKGDEIMTERGATAELILPDGSVLKIGPSSHLIVKELGIVEITKRSTNVFSLTYGKIRAVVSFFVNTKSEFVIETENASIGVRGTDFGVAYDKKKEETELVCLEGEVDVKSKEKGSSDLPPVLVKANEGLSIVAGKLPGEPIKWTEAQTKVFFWKMSFEGKKVKDHLIRGGRMLKDGSEKVKGKVEGGVKKGTEKIKSGGKKTIDTIKKIF